jgi:hypothetical protein
MLGTAAHGGIVAVVEAWLQRIAVFVRLLTSKACR